MNQKVDKPTWMTDPLVQSISQVKLDFLQDFFQQAEKKKQTYFSSQKEMLMAILPVLKQARAANISFSPVEIQNVIAAMKKHSTTEEIHQMDQIYNHFSSLQQNKIKEDTV